jgi:amino acid adenylation domain-containing protein
VTARPRRSLEWHFSRRTSPSRIDRAIHIAQAAPMHGACSRTQEALWLAEQASDIGAANSLPLTVEFEGDLDLGALAEALAAVVRVQPALHTRFVTHGGRLTRVEHDASPVAVLETVAEEVPDVEATVAQRSRLPLDLFESPSRIEILRSAPERHLLFANFHHAIFDGPSKDIFTRGLIAAYEAVASREPVVSDAIADYGAYVDLERLYTIELEPAAARYWTPVLHAIRERLQIPSLAMARTRPATGEALRFMLEPALKDELVRLADRQGISLFTLLLAAVQALQYVYAGRQDGHIATMLPMGTRSREMRGTIGVFVNEAPICSTLSAAMSFAELLAQVSERTQALFRLRHFPFNEAVARFGQGEDPRVFVPQMGLSYWKASATKAAVHGTRLNVDRLRPVYGRRWDMRFRFLDGESAMSAGLEYDSGVLDENSARRMVEHLLVLLRTIANRPTVALSELSVLDARDQHILVGEWNATQTPTDGRTTVDLFEAQVERSPDQVALGIEEQALTYRELDDRASVVAGGLAAIGAGPGSVVAICLERGSDLPLAVLAVLKTGAAYLPLDPAHPPERLRFMLEDSGASIAVSRGSVVAATRLRAPSLLLLDDDAPAPLQRDRPRHRPNVDDLAYIIYTSGSTGKPKGVEVAHGSLANFLLSTAREPGITTGDVQVAVASFSFDLAVLELLLPLVAGAHLVVASTAEATDGHALADLLRRSGATYLHATPATWQMLIAAGWSGIETAVSGGEAMSRRLARELLTRADSLWNSYGPTETTIGSTLHRVRDPENVAIGRPIANTAVYVLDRCGMLAPIGVPGELLIGGDGVARGYRNRPDLTSDRFIPNPIRSGSGRLYRTGDLVRLRHEGCLDFLGRIDHQIKLRGHRIEPGEIETTLLTHPQIDRAVVIATSAPSGQSRLVAYLVPARGMTVPSETSLRETLGRSLPAFMIPASFVTLEELPLTPSGKLDRGRLPSPGLAQQTDDYIEPRGRAEKALAAVWAEALGVARVGRNDNFFQLGGHSLLAAEVVGRARIALSMEVPLRLIFSHPTVAGVVRSLSELDGADDDVARIPRAQRRSSSSVPDQR